MKKWLKLTCLLVISFKMLAFSELKAKPQNVFYRSFQWNFLNEEFELRYAFSWESYQFYREKPRVFYNYAVYAFENKSFPFVSDFTHELLCLIDDREFTEVQRRDFVISFVQQLNYQKENGEYPKFPIETLAEKGGDCEDTSILLAAILREMGQNSILINPPGHMAIAIECDDCDGAAYLMNGKRYVYVETTASGFPVGRIPADYKTSVDKKFALKALPEELWVLNTFLPKKEAAKTVYVVREDAISSLGKSQEGSLILARRKVKTVTIGSDVATMQSVELKEKAKNRKI